MTSFELRESLDTFLEVDQTVTVTKNQLTLDLIRRLCETLEKEGINYCHWKSNAALDRSASGENDLDLLVHRPDISRFKKVLNFLGFKEAFIPNQEKIPGINDYYGYDHQSEKFVHVHAHFRLILGSDLNKNYHIPFEKAYLASSNQGILFRTPSFDFEFVLFIIRMIIKHSTWDTILGGQGRLSGKEQQEMSWLKSGMNPEGVLEILKTHLTFLDADLFDECTRVLHPGVSIWKRIKCGHTLQKQLKNCARYSPVRDLYLKIRNRLKEGMDRRVFHKIPALQLAAGGMLIVIIGGDGAGKTTSVEEITRWLGSRFEILRVHLGKPEWSVTTYLVRGILKIGTVLGLYPFSRVPPEKILKGDCEVFPGYPWLIREVCTARDRYNTYTRARQATSAGKLVICDRYPLAPIKIMDGPMGAQMTKNIKKTRFMQFLIKMEESYYRRILLPDLLVILRVDPETAVSRKPDENPEAVRARVNAIWDLDSTYFQKRVVDANLPRAEVLSRLKELIWAQS